MSCHSYLWSVRCPFGILGCGKKRALEARLNRTTSVIGPILNPEMLRFLQVKVDDFKFCQYPLVKYDTYDTETLHH